MKTNVANPASEPELSERLSYPQAAALLNLPLGTLYDLVNKHAIPHLRLGRRLVRFERTALEAWLEERRVHVAPMAGTPKGGAK